MADSEQFINSALLMDRGDPIGNSDDVFLRRAAHVKVGNKLSEPIPVIIVGGGSRMIKSRTVLGSSFSGNPKKFSVVFDVPFLNNNYIIILSGTDGRTYTYESKTTDGFVIDSNANAVITGEVSWFATSAGETS